MKVAVLTSSRADYSIYLPLLKMLKSDSIYDLNIIAFGTHVSSKHGTTIKNIISDGFQVTTIVDSMPDGDDPSAIARGMGKTMIEFSRVWAEQSFDLIIALGDRFEMFAACASSIPFGVPIAHIHGGETTLGAIDNAFRNCITQMATYHFTTTDQYKERVVSMVNSAKNVFNVGALSIDNLKSLPLLPMEAFKEQFHIDLSIPSILITFHPETVDYKRNEAYILELLCALEELTNYQLIITMPNADTMGNMIREHLHKFISKTKNAVGVESFGTLGYLSCMKHSRMLLGNTSSGFVEAAYFPKYVINLGERQSGRILTPNIVNCKIEKGEILAAVNAAIGKVLPSKVDIYGDGAAASIIIKNLTIALSEAL